MAENPGHSDLKALITDYIKENLSLNCKEYFDYYGNGSVEISINLRDPETNQVSTIDQIHFSIGAR